MGVQCRQGVGRRLCRAGMAGKELSQRRDTVFNLAEGTIEGKVLSMYSWVPSAPPARRRTVLGSSSLPPGGLGGNACAAEARKSKGLRRTHRLVPGGCAPHRSGASTSSVIWICQGAARSTMSHGKTCGRGPAARLTP